MRRSWCVPVALGLMATACAAPPRPRPAPGAPPAPKAIDVQVVDGGRRVVTRIALEDYVAATILSEFAPPSGDPAVIEGMFDIQAIISRTYAVAHLGRHRRDGFDLCSTTHCQLYEPARRRTSRWAQAAASAVGRTSGTVVWYDGGAALALFHSDCGGHTSTPVEVWGGRATPYLVSRPDDGPARPAHAAWRYAASAADVRRALNATAPTRVGASLRAIEVVGRDAAGRAERVRLTGELERVVRGEDLRTALTRAFGPRTIKSTLFDVRRAGGTFTFEGRGFGHGVGLCQAGALARLKGGAKPAEVLRRYYPGTRMVRLARPLARPN